MSDRVEGDDFWVQERPFILVLDDTEPIKEDISTVLGWTPNGSIGLAAMCNDSQDHRILGEMCLHLARKLDGWVDFGGALIPRLKGHVRDWYYSRHSLADPDWREWQPHVSRMIQSLPGRVHAIPYITATGKEWVSHICDADFLEAWLQHQDFHMIK